MQMVGGWGWEVKGVRCGGQFSDDKRWVGVRSMLSSNHSFIGDLPESASSVSLRQNVQNGLSINFLLQNDFKHNKYNKEECHKPYILSFGINNYKTNLLVPPVVIDWRLCNIKVMTNWFPSEDILELHQSFSSCYLLTCGGWRKGGRGRIREKKRERLIPSWGATIKNPYQPGYLPNALLPNTITLGIKSGHN